MNGNEDEQNLGTRAFVTRTMVNLCGNFRTYD